MNDLKFLTTGFVTEACTGPLSITSLTSTELVVNEVLSPTGLVLAELEAGRPPDLVLQSVSKLSKTEVRIPLANLESAQWVEHLFGVKLAYQDSTGKLRSKTCYILDDSHRRELLARISEIRDRPFREETELPNKWKLAWAEILGIVFWTACTAYFIGWWDPAQIGQARAGRPLLWLGQTGCIILAVGWVIGCTFYAWRRIRRKTLRYRWTW